MNSRTVLWLVGITVGAVVLAQGAALAVALALGEPWQAFAISIGTGLAVSGLLILPARGGRLALDHRSAFLAVTLSWLGAAICGAGPYIHHPAVDLGLVDALFESTSGFTTTGASVLSGLDSLPRSLLLWRAFTQWFGGIGVVLLGVAVFPILGLGGMQLYRAEAPGPTKDKITPRIAETAQLLWVLYLGLTIADGVLLIVGGMSPFDAICHAMATISTGGFSTHDASLAHWNSGFIHVVTTVFMLLGGMNFAILQRALTGRFSWRDTPELRLYLGIVAAATLLMTLDLLARRPEAFATTSDALEHALFQTASIVTTTGFATRNFDAWPALSHAVFLVLFLVGGMAGSTGGGLKVVRVLLTVRIAFGQFFRLVHPRGFSAIRLGPRTVDESALMGVLGFVAMYVLLLLAGTGLLASYGSDLMTSLSAAAVTLGNVGPGFGAAGPSHTYASFAPGAKLCMTALMILGRLEIYTVLVILTPGFWRR
ncbi:MAG: TrkH family potassium uptake protein [Myxococcota bacterium]